MTAPLPSNEEKRLSDLYEYRILDTPDEKAFDDLVQVASALFDVPIAYISFIDRDRQWIKSRVGISVREVGREHSFCAHVVAGGEVLAVNDASIDERFADNPYVIGDPYIRFYLGAPLKTPRGQTIGTLCVVDTKPRDVGDSKVSALRVLAHQVMTQLELRRANRVLLEERETFSTLFEAAPVPLMLVHDGLVERCNHTCVDLMVGRPDADLRGRPVLDFLEGLPRDHNQPTVTQLKSETGDTIPVLVHETRIRFGSHHYQLLALNDIRDRQEKERMLEEARLRAENATRIKDTFLSMVSHDLRSPLSGIFTMLDLLSRSEDAFTPEERREAFADLKSSTAVLLEMINQLLNIHRLQSGRIEIQYQRVRVRELVDQILLTLNRQISDKGIHIVLEVPRQYEVYADEGLYREAIFNLVSNAIKFSHDEGTVHIRQDGDWLCVEDQGTGIAEDEIQHLFNHSVKTSRPGTKDEPGTGLGLPLVADIMKAHGGTVSVESQRGKGSRFCLSLLSEQDRAEKDRQTG